MNCKGYQEKMLEALANGKTAPSGEIAEHLRRCGECRDFYDAQGRLLAAIEAGVRAMVNEAVPTSVLPGLRARRRSASHAGAGMADGGGRDCDSSNRVCSDAP